MKLQIVLLYLVFLMAKSFAQVPSQGLVAYYNFNRDLKKDSTRLFDFSGHKNHGTIVGYTDYAMDRHGVGCSALFFDGSTYATVPSSNSLKKPQQELTIAVWFKLAKGADFFKQWITICCKSDQSSEGPESPQFRMQATAQTVSINTEFTEQVIPQLKYEVWYFYAYTFDGQKVKVYLNGRYVFEMDYSGSLTPNDMPLEIGRDLPGALEYFYGTMDDLRIYDRALSEQELSQLFRDNTEANNADRCIVPVVVVPTPTQPPVVVVPTPTQPPVVVVPTPTQPPVVVVPTPTQPPVVVPKPTPTRDTTPTKPKTLPPPVTPNDSYTNLPPKIVDIPIKYQKTVEVQSKEVTIYPYDNEKEDGDIVSINVNGTWVLERYTLKNKKNPPPSNALIKCTLTPGDGNYFVSKAWNIGSISPNTLTIKIDDGVSVQEVQINADVGLSGGIRIVCNQ